jgi:hypothetical protein
MTEPLVLDDSRAIWWVHAPAMKTGNYFFGSTIYAREMRWWPESSKWYDKNAVAERRYGWGYEVFGQDKGHTVKWQYEPLSFPSDQQLINRGCLTTVPDEPSQQAQCKWTQDKVDYIKSLYPGHEVVWDKVSDVVTFDGTVVPYCGLPNTSGEFDPYENPELLPQPWGGFQRLEFFIEYGI